ncbi:hypothetical protein IFO69_06465 [Echinicola sp. CAU 1574]|uniref:Antitoxin component YwqK of the YwqJK toxin-antitoxin module n=1 Tax=Echinicola arenosa TaxID=2774144 RepID=A0ABR9AI26_9BACT|nr:hypothetical protein [Echinicola arenosa]MBD8488386.1 hypothetical protein [Echinicola arenosa]
MKKVVLSLLLVATSGLLKAQNFDSLSTSNPVDSSGIIQDRLLPTTTPVLLFDDSNRKEEKKKEKKKRSKNVYFGEKTRKSFIRVDTKGKTQYQLFHYTTRNKQVDPYIRNIYWLDIKDKAIRTSGFKPEEGYLLHGPYERRIDNAVVEKGMYYYGTKHGRWMTFDQKNILQTKSHFYEGWPEDSRISYYNQSQQKLEKVIPIEYDLKEGNFYHFYEDGHLAVKGEYHYGEKIGLWTEYWNTNGGKVIRKREIQYQEKPFTKNFKPYIRAEWNEEGTLIYKDNRL